MQLPKLIAKHLHYSALWQNPVCLLVVSEAAQLLQASPREDFILLPLWKSWTVAHRVRQHP